jgi:AraC-like DNA-binding protein
LQELAHRAGMSRSIFALKFRETVGTFALSLGYESESAFRKAFKRVRGCSPRQYGRGRHAKLIVDGLFQNAL